MINLPLALHSQNLKIVLHFLILALISSYSHTKCKVSSIPLCQIGIFTHSVVIAQNFCKRIGIENEFLFFLVIAQKIPFNGDRHLKRKGHSMTIFLR